MYGSWADIMEAHSVLCDLFLASKVAAGIMGADMILIWDTRSTLDIYLASGEKRDRCWLGLTSQIVFVYAKDLEQKSIILCLHV